MSWGVSSAALRFGAKRPDSVMSHLRITCSSNCFPFLQGWKIIIYVLLFVNACCQEKKEGQSRPPGDGGVKANVKKKKDEKREEVRV